MFKKLSAKLFLVLCLFTVSAAAQDTGFLERSLPLNGYDRTYQVYVPHNYDDTKEWPVILFLHGAGEQGWDGFSQTTVGLGYAVKRYAERYPAIIVFPQARPPLGWTDEDAEFAMRTLEATERQYSTDKNRVYITGLSNGGYGAWRLAYKYPDRFAAALVICGFLSDDERYNSDVPIPRFNAAFKTDNTNLYDALAQKIKHMPIWIYHGDDDNVIDVEGSRNIYRALLGYGADVKYTELPGFGHNSWDVAYRSESTAKWLFEQHK